MADLHEVGISRGEIVLQVPCQLRAGTRRPHRVTIVVDFTGNLDSYSQDTIVRGLSSECRHGGDRKASRSLGLLGGTTCEGVVEQIRQRISGTVAFSSENPLHDLIRCYGLRVRNQAPAPSSRKLAYETDADKHYRQQGETNGLLRRMRKLIRPLALEVTPGGYLRVGIPYPASSYRDNREWIGSKQPGRGWDIDPKLLTPDRFGVRRGGTACMVCDRFDGPAAKHRHSRAHRDAAYRFLMLRLKRLPGPKPQWIEAWALPEGTSCDDVSEDTEAT